MPPFNVRAARITVALALLLSLGQQSARAQVSDHEVFATSEGEVECTFKFSTEPELSCERFGPRHLLFILGPSGYAQPLDIASGEAHGFAKSLVEPGKLWSQGSFTCRQLLKASPANERGTASTLEKVWFWRTDPKCRFQSWDYGAVTVSRLPARSSRFNFHSLLPPGRAE